MVFFFLQAIADIIRTCLGPRSMFKVFIFTFLYSLWFKDQVGSTFTNIVIREIVKWWKFDQYLYNFIFTFNLKYEILGKNHWVTISASGTLSINY